MKAGIATRISKLNNYLDSLDPGPGSSDKGHDHDIGDNADIADGIARNDDYYDYYIDRDMMPPQFETYRQRRWDAASDWDRQTNMYNIDCTEDEKAFYKRRYSRHREYLKSVGKDKTWTNGRMLIKSFD